MDIAQLGFEIDSTQAKTAATNLDGMAKASANAERATDRIQASARKAADDIKAMGAQAGIAAAALGAAFGVLLKKQLDYADSVGKMADKLGVSTEFISAMGFAAKSNGSSVDAMNRALFSLVDSMKRVEGGSKSQADAFARIGVSVYSAQGGLKTVQELLPEVARGLAGITDPTERAAIAQKVLGDGSKDLLLALQELGVNGLDAVTEKAAKFGQVLTKEMTQNAADANDAIGALQFTATGFANILLADLLPAIKGVTGSAKDGIVSYDDMKAAADGLATGIKYLAVGFNFTKNAIEQFVGIVAASVDTLGALGSAAYSAVQGMKNGAQALLEAGTGNMAGAQALLNQSKASFAEIAQAGTSIKAAWSAAATGMQEGDQEFANFLSRMTNSFADVKGAASSTASEVGKAFTELPPMVVTFADSQDQLAKSAREAAKEARDQAKAAEELAGAQKSALDMLDSLRGGIDANAAAQAEFDKGMRALQATLEAWAIKGGDVTQILALWQEGESLLTDELERKKQALADQGDVLGIYLKQLSNDAKLARMTERERAMAAAVDTVTAAWMKNNKEGIKNSQTLKAVEEGARAAAEAAFDLQHIDDLIEKFSGNNGMQSLVDAAADLRAEIERLSDPMSEAFDPARVEKMKAALEGVNQEAAKTHQAMIQGILQSSQEALRGIQSMTSEGSKEFHVLNIAIAALAAAQGISAILNQAQGEPYSAFGRMAAMAAVVAPLVAQVGGSIHAVAGGGFSDSAAQRQETQGTGSVLGDTAAKSESIAKATEITANATQQLVGLNRGMLTALQALQNALGSAGGMLARGAGDADFSGMNLAVGNSWMRNGDGGVGDLFGLFKGKSKITDQGIVIFGGALNDMLNNIAVGAYQEVQSKSWAFGSTHTKTGIQDVSDEFSKQFGLVINSIADTVREGAKALGMLPADIEAAMAAFKVEETKISLKGLSAEEQQKEIEAVFSKIFDGLAGAVVPYIEQFQKVGEGLGETLVRIATEVQVTQEAFKQLGFALDETDPEKFAQISDALIQATGGLDDFISGMQSFVANFATEGHQFQVAQDALNSAFDQVGLSVPTTRDGMWELMQSLDATTEAGRQQIATLLRLSDTANQYYDLLDKRAEAAANYAGMVADIENEIATLGGSGMTDFQKSLVDIANKQKDTIESLNAAARAAGLQGAREEDLSKVHQLAAARAAAAAKQLEQQSRDLVAQLYGSGSDSITTAAQSAGSALLSVADGLTGVANAAQAFRDSMLLDSQLSPLNTQQQFDEAMTQLRATGDEGTARRALELARSLMATGADYKAAFDQITSLVRAKPEATRGSASGAYDAAANAQAQLSPAERADLAQQLARNVADLSGFGDKTYEQIAASLGLDLNKLGADLGLQGQALTDYLDAIKADSYTIDDLGTMVSREVDRIIAAILHGEDIGVSVTGSAIGAGGKGSAETVAAVPQVNVIATAKGEAPASDASVQSTNTKLDAVAGLLAKLTDVMVANVKATSGGSEETVEALRDVRAAVEDVRREVGVTGEGNFRTRVQTR